MFVIDSLKIRISIEKVKILNEAINGSWLIVNNITGEVLEKKYKEKASFVNDSGIHLRFLIEKQFINRERAETFLTILITSKVLKQDYFSGINKDTVKNVYQYLMESNQVYFTYKDFLEGNLTDVDFKYDVKGNINLYIQAVRELVKKTDLMRVYDIKVNKGIQFSNRETTSIADKPFLKIYSKDLDLFNHSKEFYTSFIKDTKSDNVDSLIRFEFTIKNKKHFKKFGVNDTSLKSVLSLSKGKKEKMYKAILENYIDLYKVKPIVIRERLSPNDKVIISLMDAVSQTGKVTFDELIKICTHSITEKSVKSRKKRELTSLFETRIKEKRKDTLKKAEMREAAIKLFFPF